MFDHCGNLAYMNSTNGFEGKILSSNKTIEISKKLISDSVYIHEKGIEQVKNGTGKRLKPLYTEEQMHDMFNKMAGISTLEYQKWDRILKSTA